MKMSNARIGIDGVSVSPDHDIAGGRVASKRCIEDRSPPDWTWKLSDFARSGDDLFRSAGRCVSSRRYPSVPEQNSLMA